MCGICVDGEIRSDIKAKVRKLCLRTFCYSYARVSLTVNLDARLAGNALASVPSTMVKINHAITPLAPYTVGIGAVSIAVPTP